MGNELMKPQELANLVWAYAKLEVGIACVGLPLAFVSRDACFRFTRCLLSFHAVLAFVSLGACFRFTRCLLSSCFR
jgi:hypothetical protein